MLRLDRFYLKRLDPRRFFFFFQAEDGIRDGRVTGVQTCALPISRGGLLRLGPALLGVRVALAAAGRLAALARRVRVVGDPRRAGLAHALLPQALVLLVVLDARSRSEERRVGKECRSRRWRDRFQS